MMGKIRASRLQFVCSEVFWTYHSPYHAEAFLDSWTTMREGVQAIQIRRPKTPLQYQDVKTLRLPLD